MTTKIKKLVGDAGAGMDKSHGSDTLYDVVAALAATINLLITSHNQLLTDYNAETAASHTTSSASAVTATFEVE